MTRRDGLPDRVILVVGLAILLNYIDRGNLATAAPLLQDELRLSSAQIGILLSSFFWAYAPAQLLAGWLVHRYDLRVVLAAGIAMWALATALTGLAGGFASILVLRLVLGLGESVTFPSWQLILARHTAEHERGRANGIVTAGQGVGPMLGTLFGGLAMAHFGWRAMFVALGAMTLLWLWPWSVVARESFDAPVEDAGHEVSYATILARRAFWGMAIGHFASNYAFYFVLTWLPTFLVKAGGFTVSEMAGIGAAIYAIYAATTVFTGAASDRWIRGGGAPTFVRKTFAVVGAGGTAVTIACCAFVEPRAAVWLLGVAGLCFGFGSPMIFTMAATLAGPRAAGRWAGVQNLAGQLAGVAAPMMTGFIVERTGAFTSAFAVAAAAALLSLVAWAVIVPEVAPVRWPDERALAAAVPTIVAL